MPLQQSTKSSIGKYAGRGAGIVKESMESELKLGGARLPAGIERGVARLDNCRITEIKDGAHKGEYRFYADGIVFSPVVHNGEKIANLRTHIFAIDLCDTDDKVKPGDPGSWEYQWKEKLIPQLRGLCQVVGEDMVAQIDPTGEGDPATMLRNATALCQKLQNEIKPWFRFRTWQGPWTTIARNQKDNLWYVWNCGEDHKTPIDIVEYKGKKRGPYQTEQEARTKNKNAGKEPLVNHQWLGAIAAPDEVAEPTDAPGAEDNSGDASTPPPAMKGEHNGPPPAPPKKASTKSPPPVPSRMTKPAPQEEDQIPDGDPLGGSDLDQIVADCSNSDDPEACEGARARLWELAANVAGMSDDDCTNADSFADIGDAIRSAIESRSSSPAAEEIPPAEVSVKQVYLYKFPGTKKPVHAAVTAVDKKETPWRVNLLSLADNKTTAKRVSVDDLRSASGS